MSWFDNALGCSFFFFIFIFFVVTDISYIPNRVDGVLVRWELGGKVLCCTTDQASNIKKAMSELNSESGIKWSACASHKLQLCVTYAFSNTESVKVIFDKCAALSMTFRNVEHAARVLEKAQLELNAEKHAVKPKVFTPIRWNSKFDMATRLSRLLPAISEVLDNAKQGSTANDRLLQKDVEPNILTEHETLVLTEVLSVLEPASKVTQSLSADRQSTISREYAEVHNMINTHDDLITAEAQEFRNKLVAQ